MPTDAQRLANRRYYQKTRATRLVAMRERAKTRAAERNEYLMTHPEELEAIREASAQRYQTAQTNKRRRIIEGWLDDPGVSPTFKAFLRTNVLTVVDRLPNKFLDMCLEHLAIAVNPAHIIPGWTVDARAVADATDTAQGR